MYYDMQTAFKPDEILEYLRKSRADDPSLSVEEVLRRHESILSEWAERNLDSPIPKENIYREVVSGETIDDRPEMLEVLRRIESPKIKAILVVEIQRLSRGDLEDAGRIIKLLRYTNTLVITPQKTYNLNDEYDRDFFERELKRGNEFLEYQKKIMNRGRLLSVSQGNYIGSTPPYGFEIAWVMDGKKKCPVLKPKDDEVTVLNMAYTLYVNENWGMNRICNHFDSLGIKPPKGSHWSPPALKGMLENIHNIGKVKWNWRKTHTSVEDGELIKTRPKAKEGDYLIFDGKHPAIVSDELFYAALKKRGKNPRLKGNTKIRNPFAGLLYCKCGRAMSMRTYTCHSGKARLLCDDQTHCNTGSCLFEEMMDLVCNILEKSITDFEMQLKNNNDNSLKFQQKIINNLEKTLKELEAKELAQWEAQANPNPADRMPQEIFRQLNEKLLKEKEEVQQALFNARNSMPRPVEFQEKIVRFSSALSALKNPDIPAEEKNKLLKSCIERIEYTREAPYRQKPGTSDDKCLPKAHGGWVITPISLDVKLKV